MVKYILLAIPFFYFKYSSLAQIINLTVVLIFLIFLLRSTTLRNVFDWIIGICFTIYFCILFDKTVYFHSFIIDDYHYSVKYIKLLFHQNVNLIPIKGIIDELRYHSSALYQILGNTIMLTPMAFSMLYFKRAISYKKAIWYCFICTVGIEFVQLLQNLFHLFFIIGMSRSIDIDDVILNTIGAGIGMGCYYLWSKVENRFKKRDLSIPI